MHLHDLATQVLDIPNEIKVGYSPIGFVRCGRSASRIPKLVWKMGKETGGKKMEDPHSLKSNEMAEYSFQPQQPLVCDTFKNCEGLSRVTFLGGNGGVMLGKMIFVRRKRRAVPAIRRSRDFVFIVPIRKRRCPSFRLRQFAHAEGLYS